MAEMRNGEGGSVIAFKERELDLIRRTVAKDCNTSEFDWFIHICQHTGLDPLRRQIYAFVFHKDDTKKRQMVPVTGIGGFRSIAARTGNYRADDKAPRIEYDPVLKNALTNPLGILRAEVSPFMHSHGEWFPQVGEAYWDDYAPVKEEWGEDEATGRRAPTGKFFLDPNKTGWLAPPKGMPRVMLPKCAEANGLRKGWPDDFGGLYEESELDRAITLDLTPSEMAERGATEKRLELIGGSDAIMVDWCDGGQLVRVPLDQFASEIDQMLDQNADEPGAMLAWRDRNRHGLQEFWAKRKHEAIEIKKRFEKVEAQARRLAGAAQ